MLRCLLQPVCADVLFPVCSFNSVLSYQCVCGLQWIVHVFAVLFSASVAAMLFSGFQPGHCLFCWRSCVICLSVLLAVEVRLCNRAGDIAVQVVFSKCATTCVVMVPKA